MCHILSEMRDFCSKLLQNSIFSRGFPAERKKWKLLHFLCKRNRAAGSLPEVWTYWKIFLRKFGFLYLRLKSIRNWKKTRWICTAQKHLNTYRIFFHSEGSKEFFYPSPQPLDGGGRRLPELEFQKVIGKFSNRTAEERGGGGWQPMFGTYYCDCLFLKIVFLQAACVLAITSPAVTIKNIECAIIDYAFLQGWMKPEKPTVSTGKRIAIIGSGPAGQFFCFYCNSHVFFWSSRIFTLFFFQNVQNE